MVFGNAEVYGNAKVYGYAEAFGNAEVNTINSILRISNCGELGRELTITYYQNSIYISAGCFHDTLSNFKKAVIKKYGKDYGLYSRVIRMLDTLTEGDFK